MKTNVKNIESILGEARVYLIPIYQRKYQWGEKQLEAFWQDVAGKASDVLEGPARFEHYMGALILSSDDSDIGKTPQRLVIDGQQRLTTFQLFLAALREVSRKYEANDKFIKSIDEYLLNKTKSDDPDDACYKIWPTDSDKEIIHDIIRLEADKLDIAYRGLYYGKRVPKNTPQPAFLAYDRFRKWIDLFAIDRDNEQEEYQPDIDSIEKRLQALLEALLKHLKLVTISLENNDDAQVIFETLNSKGKPLLAMDLVKNNVFHRAKSDDAKTLYAQYWKPFDDVWWQEKAPNARPAQQRIDHFLTNYLVAETGHSISHRELYSEYKAFVTPSGVRPFENVEAELECLGVYASVYENLEGNKNDSDALVWFGRKLSAWQFTTVYPVAMQMGVSSDLDEAQKKEIFELIYSYLVRRTICGMTPKNMNNVFISLAAYFKREGTIS